MKKCVFIWLLICVTMGTVFAAEGRTISFTQMTAYNDVITVTGIKESSNGIDIAYRGLKTDPIGLNFLAVVYYNNNTVMELYNNESMIGKDKTYTLGLRADSPWNITRADIYLGKTKSGVRESFHAAVADKVLSAASQLQELNEILDNYSTTIRVLSTVSTLKDTVKFLQDGQAMLSAARTYRNARGEGDRETARRDLLKTMLDPLEFAGNLGMSQMQGKILAIAIKGVKNAIDAGTARNDRTNWTATVALASVNGNYEELAEGVFASSRYATLGMRLYQNNVSMSEIAKVFKALEKINF